ncbi:hypothetical protein [Pseudoprimorskyibacter insulae]|uniref:Uncharacterized protein n=1 Tax=Pseudoprimorskyibacter insulae TaxID=1695997 RepID=A0A2R8AQS3_9RHOB|nr:hypothetical protein [Pseudoprimorskyibacter insulae]SPF78320.1 hypothetical protein PRI8871_00916 [Pseudoprimorskyibacter insulae]
MRYLIIAAALIAAAHPAAACDIDPVTGDLVGCPDMPEIIGINTHPTFPDYVREKLSTLTPAQIDQLVNSVTRPAQ